MSISDWISPFATPLALAQTLDLQGIVDGSSVRMRMIWPAPCHRRSDGLRLGRCRYRRLADRLRWRADGSAAPDPGGKPCQSGRYPMVMLLAERIDLVVDFSRAAIFRGMKATT